MEKVDKAYNISDVKLVSILIPSFNHGHYIVDCLESILSLTYPRIEILISDDCSWDNTMEIINSYKNRLEKKAERVLINQNQHNIGICKNCNLIWKMAKGEYYKFIASDDMLLPDSISKLVNYMETHKSYNIVHANVFEIGKRTHYPLQSFKQYTVLYSDKFMQGTGLTARLIAGNNLLAVSVMISRETKEKYGLFDERLLFEDWEYWLRVSISGEIGYLNDIVGGYRVLKSSASHFGKSEYGRQRNYIITKIRIWTMYKKYVNDVDICQRILNTLWVEARRIKDRRLIEYIEYEAGKCSIHLSMKYRMAYGIKLEMHQVLPKNVRSAIKKVFNSIMFFKLRSKNG